MNIIQNEILKLLYHDLKGLRVRDMINRVSIREYTGSNDLRVNSNAYKVFTGNLNRLRRYGFVRRIRHDGKDKGYRKDGNIYWILTKSAREKKYEYQMRKYERERGD